MCFCGHAATTESDLISLDFNASGLVLILPMNFIGLIKSTKTWSNLYKIEYKTAIDFDQIYVSDSTIATYEIIPEYTGKGPRHVRFMCACINVWYNHPSIFK